MSGLVVSAGVPLRVENEQPQESPVFISLPYIGDQGEAVIKKTTKRLSKLMKKEKNVIFKVFLQTTKMAFYTSNNWYTLINCHKTINCYTNNNYFALDDCYGTNNWLKYNEYYILSNCYTTKNCYITISSYGQNNYRVYKKSVISD